MKTRLFCFESLDLLCARESMSKLRRRQVQWTVALVVINLALLPWGIPAAKACREAFWP